MSANTGGGTSGGPFTRAKLGPITLPNRFIKAATFEGMAPDHLVTDALVEFHRAVAAGGVGMTTLAYCAVSLDGQGAPGEIIVRDEAVPGLRRFAEAIHELGAMASIQLGHAGPVAAGIGKQGLTPSRIFALQAMTFTRAMTEADIARVTTEFARAATLAVDAGFDAVELHFGHGYLISSFLSPKLNRRKDRWGGSVAHRARFARQVAAAVREAVGDRAAVIAKHNMDDGVPGGLSVDESIEAARLLEADGALDALELTGGSSFQNPMYLFRGEAPIRELAREFPQPLRLGFKLTARWFMRAYPFEEAYFLPNALRFRAALAMPLILLGGSTASRRSNGRWPMGSTSSPWGARCCASRRWSTVGAAGTPARRRATTATSAFRRSTRAPAACSSNPPIAPRLGPL